MADGQLSLFNIRVNGLHAEKNKQQRDSSKMWDQFNSVTFVCVCFFFFFFLSF